MTMTDKMRNQARAMTHTGILSAYFCLILSDSALRLSKGCSSLNLERMMMDFRNQLIGMVGTDDQGK
jgi:hypothetical protein